MLDLTTDNTIALADVPWSQVASVAVDRIAWETWTKHSENGEPTKGASLLDAGHHFTTMVVYRDDTWHSVAWSVSKDEIQSFAVKLASDTGLPLQHNPSWIAYARSLIRNVN